MKRTIPFIALVLVTLISSCSSKKEEKTNTVDSAILVQVASPSSNNSKELNLSGQIESSQSVNISTRMMGFITSINVKVGDHVSKGQLLVSISNDDIKAKRAQTDAMISEAEAAFNNAKKDQERFNNLYKQQSASAKEMDNINFQYNSAKSRLESAKQMRNEVSAMMSYAQLSAPFSGVVTQKMLEAGSMASPGMPILTIEQSGVLQVSVSVPENSIQQIQLGSNATVQIQSVEKIFQSTVSQINPSSQFTGGQFIVKIKIPELAQKGLYSGMYANISIPLKNATATTVSNADAVLVPLSAIEYKNQLTGLYTVSSNNRALLRWVRLGKTYGSNVEVLSGLEKNENFIIKSEGKLFNGASVKTK
ncbi:MAG: efflux RND transporter periplasmic adaptor subunit [Bacteroidetes bacterium]|nr:efflux RND transporter periplasmic adaptor subunit [Bacteroidota bacterium]